MDLSVIIPVYNEVESLPHLHQSIHQALDPLKIQWEAVFVDDGSTDGSRDWRTCSKDQRERWWCLHGVTLVQLLR
jgi:GT2 family glycosyltransferase